LCAMSNTVDRPHHLVFVKPWLDLSGRPAEGGVSKPLTELDGAILSTPVTIDVWWAKSQSDRGAHRSAVAPSASAALWWVWVSTDLQRIAWKSVQTDYTTIGRGGGRPQSHTWPESL
jgi:hypothetical protein